MKQSENLKTEISNLKQKFEELAKKGKIPPEDLLEVNGKFDKVYEEYSKITTRTEKLIDDNNALKNSNYSLLMRIADNTKASEEPQTAPKEDANTIFTDYTDELIKKLGGN